MSKEIVSFKSGSEYFQKEKSGKKPNTVREVDLSDTRFHILRKWETTGKFGIIEIEETGYHTFPEKHIFQREIEDVSSFKNLVIISWEHQDG